MMDAVREVAPVDYSDSVPTFHVTSLLRPFTDLHLSVHNELSTFLSKINYFSIIMAWIFHI